MKKAPCATNFFSLFSHWNYWPSSFSFFKFYSSIKPSVYMIFGLQHRRKKMKTFSGSSEKVWSENFNLGRRKERTILEISLFLANQIEKQNKTTQTISFFTFLQIFIINIFKFVILICRNNLFYHIIQYEAIWFKLIQDDTRQKIIAEIFKQWQLSYLFLIQ